MYFDRGEKFMRTIYGSWQQYRKKFGLLKLIHKIEQAKSEDSVGLQAPTFWPGTRTANWWKRDIGEKDLLLRMRMIAAACSPAIGTITPSSSRDTGTGPRETSTVACRDNDNRLRSAGVGYDRSPAR